MERILRGFVAVLAVAVMPAVALAAGPQRLGEYKDWGAYVSGTGDGKVCYMHAEPKTRQHHGRPRGDTYAQVAHRPGDDVKGEISITAGYPYKNGVDAMLEIDGKKFDLFTQDDTAWVRDRKTEGEIVEAMIRGHNMIVRGISSRGTQTTDTWSLNGFTAAWKAIGKACNVK